MNELIQTWQGVAVIVALVIIALYVIGYYIFIAIPREREFREYRKFVKRRKK